MSRPRIGYPARHRSAIGFRLSSFRNIRMAGGDAVAAGVKDERLALVVFVLFNFTYENDMVAAIILTNLAADELGNGAMQKRNPSGTFLKFDSSKLVGQRSGELP